MAIENLARPPERRLSFLVPYDVKPAKELGSSAIGVPDELV